MSGVEDVEEPVVVIKKRAPKGHIRSTATAAAAAEEPVEGKPNAEGDAATQDSDDEAHAKIQRKRQEQLARRRQGGVDSGVLLDTQELISSSVSGSGGASAGKDKAAFDADSNAREKLVSLTSAFTTERIITGIDKNMLAFIESRLSTNASKGGESGGAQNSNGDPSNSIAAAERSLYAIPEKFVVSQTPVPQMLPTSNPSVVQMGSASQVVQVDLDISYRMANIAATDRARQKLESEAAGKPQLQDTASARQQAGAGGGKRGREEQDTIVPSRYMQQRALPVNSDRASDALAADRFKKYMKR